MWVNAEKFPYFKEGTWGNWYVVVQKGFANMDGECEQKVWRKLKQKKKIHLFLE